MLEAEGATPATLLCSVEELALAHYRHCGFDQGNSGPCGHTGGCCHSILSLWEALEGSGENFITPVYQGRVLLHGQCSHLPP